jgi:hypothetical protein
MFTGTSLAQLIGAGSFSLLMASGTACQSAKSHQDDAPPIPTLDTSSRPVSDDPDRIIHHDLTHVDPQTIAPQARTVALRNDPHAELTRILTTGPLHGGTLNLLGDGSVLYAFDFDYYDKSQPQGQDKRDGALSVIAQNGRFSVTRFEHAMHVAGPTPYDPIPDPRCPLQAAWQKVVASGVPANAVATADYRPAERPARPGSPLIWIIKVAGHEEYHRKVDDQSCEIFGLPAAKPAGR